MNVRRPLTKVDHWGGMCLLSERTGSLFPARRPEADFLPSEMEKCWLFRGNEYGKLADRRMGLRRGRAIAILNGAGRFHKDETAHQRIGPEARLDARFPEDEITQVRVTQICPARFKNPLIRNTPTHPQIVIGISRDEL